MLHVAPVPMNKRVQLNQSILWFDVRRAPDLLFRAIQSGFTGVILDEASLDQYEKLLSDRLTVIIEVTPSFSTERIKSNSNVILASKDNRLLHEFALRGYKTLYQAYVDDAKSLADSIRLGSEHPYVSISFKDPTNIPLELVIASLQTTETVLIKEIAPHAVDDAVVAVGVMEVGAEGIQFTPETHEEMDRFLDKWNSKADEQLNLQVGRVIESIPVGMGYRSCIDLATLFNPNEGMLVGSTSTGGILCCPEVFHLPYMELRPFRVNAGAVHSYVYHTENQTKYMTELKAGSSVMIVDTTGKVRKATVGRMKTEIRPLRLIKIQFDNKQEANILLQDDWHVRVYSDEGKPLNITELKEGDRVLGYATEPGRHVGIKVSEHILEV